MRPLVVVPTYVRTEDQLTLVEDCLISLQITNGGDYEVAVVDDGSPFQERLSRLVIDRTTFGWYPQERNAGFSTTVNVGLMEAHETGRDAILLNSDVEVPRLGWQMPFRLNRDLADVQGAVLLFPGDPPLVQHGGVYFSVLRREFDHIHRYAPADLPDLDEAKRCPVTAALMQISVDTIDKVGYFDEDFRLGWEDVDYCIRVFEAGLECRVNPDVRAIHHESAFRGDPSSKHLLWQDGSMRRLWEKHSGTNFSSYIPTMLGV
jgi:GT2 family glycosyltransferase